MTEEKVHLVKQEEESKTSSIQPWEVEGEKEGQNSHILEGIALVENTAKLLYTHKCNNLNCQAKKQFHSLMKFRRFILPVRDYDKDLYEALFTAVAIYTKFGCDAEMLNLIISMGVVNLLKTND
jgi:hypothetical protein